MTMCIILLVAAAGLTSIDTQFLRNLLVYCIIDIRSNNACNISRFMVK